jgi:ABC-type phosphate/phosphonate transport system substrate-binding protein
MLAIAALASAPPKEIKVGLIRAMLRDVPRARQQTLEKQFREVMTAQTGFEGDVVMMDAGADGRRALTDGDVQLVVFSGLDFAWSRPKNQTLMPLVIAVPDPDALRAVLVVAQTDPAKDVAALKGKTLALPSDTTDDALQFLTRKCPTPASPLASHFAKITTPASLEDALDDVVDGTAQAALVDAAALKMFERRKPSRRAKLRVLLESAPLPPSVLAYRSDKLDAATVTKLRDGLQNAHSTEAGQRLLSQIRVKRFDAPPADFDKTLAEAARTLPPG